MGAILFGLILLAVGGYYLLRNTFGIDIPELSWDAIWPLLVIVLGVGLVWRELITRGGPSANQPK
jgi:TRAP-type C4-dicarboxylate transport system permease small subunit